MRLFRTAGLWGAKRAHSIPDTIFLYIDVTSVATKTTGVAARTASVHVSSYQMINMRMREGNDRNKIARAFTREVLKAQKILKVEGYERIAVTG